MWSSKDEACDVKIHELFMSSLDAVSCKRNKLSLHSSTFCTLCSSHVGFELRRHSSRSELGFRSSTAGQVYGNPIKRSSNTPSGLMLGKRKLIIISSSVVDASSDHQE